MDPVQRVGVIAMAALVNDEVEPLLVAKALPGPVHPGRVCCHRCVDSSVKGCPPDSLPALPVGPFIVIVSRHDPNHVVGAIARLQVANQADHFRLWQGITRVHWP